MATFTAIRNKKQSAGVLRSVIEYVEQDKKTRWGDARLVTGHNCVPQSALTEMQMTKQRFRKTDYKESVPTKISSLVMGKAYGGSLRGSAVC